jgi:hypothetical protein
MVTRAYTRLFPYGQQSALKRGTSLEEHISLDNGGCKPLVSSAKEDSVRKLPEVPVSIFRPQK